MTGPFGRVSKRSAASMNFEGPEACTCLDCREAGISAPSVAVPDNRRDDEQPMARWIHGLELQRLLDLKAELQRRVSSASEAARFS